jgi:hypothetical protein
MIHNYVIYHVGANSSRGLPRALITMALSNILVLSNLVYQETSPAWKQNQQIAIIY